MYAVTRCWFLALICCNIIGYLHLIQSPQVNKSIGIQFIGIRRGVLGTYFAIDLSTTKSLDGAIILKFCSNLIKFPMWTAMIARRYNASFPKHNQERLSARLSLLPCYKSYDQAGISCFILPPFHLVNSSSLLCSSFFFLIISSRSIFSFNFSHFHLKIFSPEVGCLLDLTKDFYW